EKVIREGILRFNAAKAIVTTPTGGYHETMTLFWIAMVRNFLRDVTANENSVTNLFNRFIEVYDRKELLFEYYSRERLVSAEARAAWVEPDLRALVRTETR